MSFLIKGKFIQILTGYKYLKNSYDNVRKEPKLSFEIFKNLVEMIVRKIGLIFEK